MERGKRGKWMRSGGTGVLGCILTVSMATSILSRCVTASLMA